VRGIVVTLWLICLFGLWWFFGTFALVRDFQNDGLDVTAEDLVTMVFVFGWSIGNLFWFSHLVKKLSGILDNKVLFKGKHT
jgi:hypothetical protein